MFVRRKEAERGEARRLRRLGWSLNAIAEELGVAKSSVSVWVRDIGAPPGPLRAERRKPAARSQPLSGLKRTCGRCALSLPVEEFNRAGTGHQHWCRSCFRAYFRERGELHRRQSGAARKLRRAEARALVRDYLGGRRCADCGGTDAVVLEFDHVGTKRGEIARMIGVGVDRARLEAEIAECEVVCANCHRRRTLARAGGFRVTAVPARSWSAAALRNHRWLLEYLRANPCCDCGESDPVVLEFDHRRDKRAAVSKLAPWCSLAVLVTEVAKCDVRCANCHRRRTYGTTGAHRLRGLESGGPP